MAALGQRIKQTFLKVVISIAATLLFGTFCFATSSPINGIAQTDAFGTSVSYVGDVNNDGYGDYIVGAHLSDVFTTVLLKDAGSARIISGQTGQTLFTFNGDSAKDYFGFSVAGAGDVDGDGVPDVAVGAYLDDTIVNGVKLTDAGSVKVFSGATGNLIYQVWGTSSKEYFGYSVAGIHNVDGDNKTDIAVGAPLADVVNNVTLKLMRDAGKIQIFTGGAGTLYRTYFGDAASDNLGRAVAYAGDINFDNFGDVIAGAPLGDVFNTFTLKLMRDAGYARVYSPNTDTVLNSGTTLKGSAAGDNFGFSVSGAGDANNDGTDDVIIGAHKADVVNTITFKLTKDAGTATIYSGADWNNVIHTFKGIALSDNFGFTVSSAGDINFDNFDDVSVGSPLFDVPIRCSTRKVKDAGRVTVYSGNNGTPLIAVNGLAASDNFGWSISGGDTDSDNVSDIEVGTSKDDVIINGINLRDAGSVTVISGAINLVDPITLPTFCATSSPTPTATKTPTFTKTPTPTPWDHPTYTTTITPTGTITVTPTSSPFGATSSPSPTATNSPTVGSGTPTYSPVPIFTATTTPTPPPLSRPTLIPVAGVLTVNESGCTQVADASGGTPPYYFSHDSFAYGAHPLGTTLDLNGFLCGSTAQEGVFQFQVCVVDLVGAEDCQMTSVTVSPAPPTATPAPTTTATPTATQAPTVTPAPTATASFCACVFDVYSTAFGPGGAWICHNTTESNNPGFLTSPGVCECRADLYQVCQ